jgi:transglutaminase-like putative cysteine protease
MKCYSTQSRFTDPGALAPWLDDVGPKVADIRCAATQLVFHYRARGDITDHGFPPERRAEIDLRYADDMFGRLYELNPAPPGKARTATERVVGCCRDSTLLFVAMARHHGIPARARVGFATYLLVDWAVDHVIAEVWDAAQQRWRLVEPEFEDGQVDVDLLDVPRDKFLVGADAWAACRVGSLDPERLDALAAELRAPDLTVDRVAAAFDVEGLRVPDVITSVTPDTQRPRQVTLRRATASA